MTTTIANTYKHPVPVTPPPDNESFHKEPLSPDPARSQEMFGSMSTMFQTKPHTPPQSYSPLPTSSPTPRAQNMPHPQTHSSMPPPPVPQGHQRSPLDPEYLAMASRISAYYQQRSQAVANYQQQRCIAWANTHRQKCQEMMRACLLVVAWYARDRVKRRRRREKRKFRKGLLEKCTKSRVTKGETVRRWVLDVPSDVMSQSEDRLERLVDQEEAEFTMDKESSPDPDSKLFSIADGLIRNQLAQVNVPLMGVLNFDESDSESEEEEDEEDEEEEDDDEEDEEDDMEEDDFDEDMQEEDDVYEDDEIQGCHGSSKYVHVNSGKGTGRRTKSTASS